MTSPSEQEYTWRTVAIVVDGFPVCTMYIWSDSTPAAIIDVCEQAAKLMREQVKRLHNNQRYANWKEAIFEETDGGSLGT